MVIQKKKVPQMKNVIQNKNEMLNENMVVNQHCRIVRLLMEQPRTCFDRIQCNASA